MPGKPERPFPRRPEKKRPDGFYQGVRWFVSENGARLQVTGRGGHRAILTLPSGATSVFVVRRNIVRGSLKDIVTREIAPDTPEKSGKFEPISNEDLDILRYEFPVLRQFGWPI